MHVLIAFYAFQKPSFLPFFQFFSFENIPGSLLNIYTKIMQHQNGTEKHREKRRREPGSEFGAINKSKNETKIIHMKTLT
jgi:hypothetical protein